jgi:hypothetical protein
MLVLIMGKWRLFLLEVRAVVVVGEVMIKADTG